MVEQIIEQPTVTEAPLVEPSAQKAVGVEVVNPAVRYERIDINFNKIIWFGSTMTVVIIFGAIISAVIFGSLSRGLAASKSSPFPLAQTERGKLPNEPRLEQIDKGTMPYSLLAGQDKTWSYQKTDLDSYGWVDENKKVARIPIGDAMKLLEQKLATPPAKEAKP